MRRVSVLAIVMAIVFFVIPIAAADQGAIGDGFSSADPGSVGPLVSGFIYGNTSNPSGNGEGVLPSLAPGPWACDYDGNGGSCYGPTLAGGSMGDYLAPVASGAVASPDFANSKDTGPDFSG